ncbi:MAG: hypothetical protein WA160_16400 [Pseudobdellovibrio sp.]
MEVKETPKESPREPAATQEAFHLRFEQCTVNSRLYLEDQIKTMPEEYYRSHEAEWVQKIPMSCIQIAQRNFAGNFASCLDSNARPTTSAMKPCMTENYTTLTYNAYHDVMDCFNLDPKEFFLQIMIESGFHVNAINKTGFDSGMAQFTKSGIKRVTANNLVSRTQRLLLESSRSSCQRVSSIVGSFDISAFAVKNRCSMISLPENPYRAMVFNYLHTMLDRISLEEVIENIPDLRLIITTKIKRHLIYLAYNRGVTGTRNLIEGYIQSRKNVNHALVAEDFELDRNLSNVKTILRKSPEKKEILKSAKKIRNLSFAEYAVIHGATYISDMAQASEYSKRYLGDDCGGL